MTKTVEQMKAELNETLKHGLYGAVGSNTAPERVRRLNQLAAERRAIIAAQKARQGEEG